MLKYQMQRLGVQMEKLLNNKLEDVIDCIKESSEYKKCLELQNKMNDNDEIKELINNIKVLQKKYIKSNYSESVKNELDEVTCKLNNIPIYVSYLDNLEKVNYKIEYVKDYLNDYFVNLLNNK